MGQNRENPNFNTFGTNGVFAFKIPTKLNNYNVQTNKDKLVDIEKELSSLNQTMKKFIPDKSSIMKYISNLKEINLKLWDIEDGKRQAEKNNDFGEKFVELARNVYKFNDERAKIKLAINSALGSNIKEVKSYE